jgi:5-methyltetrahydrofolate--homocysteine methyltransferase
MREELRAVLRRGERLLLDGSMGALLYMRGLPPGVMPEVWLWERPEAVQQVHAEYAAAGARLVTINSLGGSSIRLAEAGLHGRVRETNHRAARLAREAVGDEVWVAGSVGPTGRLLEPYGELTVAAAEAAFREQVLGLAEGGADALLIETQHDLEEACCALRVALEWTSLPALVTFAFNTRGRTMMGLRPSAAAERLEALGAAAIGANCGDGPEAVLAALRGFAGCTALPLIAQANAGIPRAEGGQTCWDVSPEQMMAHAQSFIEQGAQLVGACCGSTPAHIRALAALF